MMDEMGRDGFKFGNFDTDRCASISGPRKSRFWQFFPNFLKENLDFSVWGLALESCSNLDAEIVLACMHFGADNLH